MISLNSLQPFQILPTQYYYFPFSLLYSYYTSVLYQNYGKNNVILDIFNRLFIPLRIAHSRRKFRLSAIVVEAFRRAKRLCMI